MKKLILSTAIIFAVASNANATKFTDSLNEYTTNQPIANGGAGGQGGNANGVGIAGAISESLSSVNGSGNSNIKNNVKNNQKLLNTIKAHNSQKQLQDQSLINSNKAINGGNKSRNDNLALNEGNNSDLKTDVNTDVNIVNKQSKIPVNPAYSPSLTATGNCLGSVSFGVQGASLGISGGSTTLDKGCDLKRLVELTSKQFNLEVGNTLLCQQDERVRQALIASTGFDCKPDRVKVTYSYKSDVECEFPNQRNCVK